MPAGRIAADVHRHSRALRRAAAGRRERHRKSAARVRHCRFPADADSYLYELTRRVAIRAVGLHGVIQPSYFLGRTPIFPCVAAPVLRDTAVGVLVPAYAARIGPG